MYGLVYLAILLLAHTTYQENLTADGYLRFLRTYIADYVDEKHMPQSPK